LWCTFEEISVDHRLIEVPQLKFLESSTMSTVNPQTWLMSAVLLVSVQAQAANDFNSSRSNLGFVARVGSRVGSRVGAFSGCCTGFQHDQEQQEPGGFGDAFSR
jgi:hypothetical protein